MDEPKEVTIQTYQGWEEFYNIETRTFISFLNACHILGMKISQIRGTTTSSEVKGESQEDTIRTFASYVDLIIIRHPEAGFAEKTAWKQERNGMWMRAALISYIFGVNDQISEEFR